MQDLDLFYGFKWVQVWVCYVVMQMYFKLHKN